MKIVRSPARTEHAVREDLLPTAADLDHAAMATKSFALLSKVQVLRCAPLDRDDLRVWLALECLQVTGSFKIRGALAALARRQGTGITKVVTASAGNHGAGVARIAPHLGMQATIVVPETAPKKKIDRIAKAGATIVQHGDGYDAAEAFAMDLAKKTGEPYVSAYDDIDVIAGNGGSLAMEIVDVVEPSLVLAPIGGGGLATGLACGFAYALGESYGEIPRVWGVQGDRSPAFALSIEQGAAVTTLPYAKTLADGLEGGIAERAYLRAAGVLAGALVVTEERIEEAMRFAFHELGLVIEGSAAAALAPLLEGISGIEVSGDLVCVLSGRNVDRERLLEIVC